MKVLTSIPVIAALLLLPPSQAAGDTQRSQPQASTEIVAPVPTAETIPSPVLDERSYQDLRDKQGGNRVYQLDKDSGQVRFGDGVSGRRPPAGERETGEQRSYRHGTDRAGDVPAVPTSPSQPVPVPYPNITTEMEEE